MNYSGGGRHYRVVRNEIEKESQKDGIYIEKEKKSKFFLFAVCITMLVFVKGIIFGCMISKNRFM